eukprot:gene13709-4627_t
MSTKQHQQGGASRCSSEAWMKIDYGLWPSRIRVDYGIENVSVCDAMVVKRGYNSSSFIAGSSTSEEL